MSRLAPHAFLGMPSIFDIDSIEKNMAAICSSILLFMSALSIKFRDRLTWKYNIVEYKNVPEYTCLLSGYIKIHTVVLGKVKKKAILKDREQTMRNHSRSLEHSVPVCFNKMKAYKSARDTFMLSSDKLEARLKVHVLQEPCLRKKFIISGSIQSPFWLLERSTMKNLYGMLSCSYIHVFP